MTQLPSLFIPSCFPIKTARDNQSGKDTGHKMYPVRDDMFKLIPWADYQEEILPDHVHNFSGSSTERENKDRMLHGNMSVNQSRQLDLNDSSCLLSEPTRTPQPYLSIPTSCTGLSLSLAQCFLCQVFHMCWRKKMQISGVPLLILLWRISRYNWPEWLACAVTELSVHY